MKKIILLVFVLCAIVLVYKDVFMQRDSREVVIANESFELLVSDTDVLRHQGLSGVASLESHEGMLFIFDTPRPYGFWMKEMKIAIDIIWLDEEGVVVDYRDRVEPDTYPEVFRPQTNALYVIELVAGTRERVGLLVGDQINLAG